MNKSSELSTTYGATTNFENTPWLARSAISWRAILAGAVAAAALSLILLILGTGLGLSAVSPWVHTGVSATTFGLSTILWLTMTQLIAAGMGGYLAGRLRTKHTDDAYFQDTAHGFLTWATASLVTAAMLTSVIGTIINGGIQAGASLSGQVATTMMAATAGGAAQIGSEMARPDSHDGAMAYFVDSLFRNDTNVTLVTPLGTTPQTMDVSTSEVARIFMNAMWAGLLPAEDIRYIGQMVAHRTGLTQQNAEKRVRETYARWQTALNTAKTTAREAADTARKASAYTPLWLFISLLIGAFSASLAATYGGRQRDR